MNSKITQPGATKTDRINSTLSIIKYGLFLALLFLPEIAAAQTVTISTTSTTFNGISTELKAIAQALIYSWGYYIGIITLAVQGFRWKAGRIDTMHLFYWGCGIFLLFFAPNIVNDIKGLSSGTIQ